MKRVIKAAYDLGYDFDDLISEYAIRDINTCIRNPEKYSIPADLMEQIRQVNAKINQLRGTLLQDVIGPVQKKENEKKHNEMVERSVAIPLTQSQADLIDVVIGQMSDGYWENNGYYAKMWPNFHLTGTTLYIDINRIKYSGYSERLDRDVQLLSKPDTAKQWFAKRAQTVQNANLKDDFGSTRLKGHEDEQASYLDRGVNQTFGQIQKAIDSLK